MMNLKVHAAMGVVIRPQDGEQYDNLIKYMEQPGSGDSFDLLSIYETGIYEFNTVDETEKNDLVVVIESTVTDFDCFSGRGVNPVVGAFEFSSLKIRKKEFRQLNKFLQEFEVEKPVDMIVWNYVS